MRDHKSLLAWKRARAVVDIVVEIGLHHWTPPAGAVIGQLSRSSLSTQINIAEGYALRSGPRFRYHLNVAYGSAVESTELLELLLDHRLAPEPLVEQALRNAREVQALTLGLLRKYSSTA
jgi:four helix bundle protein